MNPRDLLAPWLTPERAHEWDILVAWKMDRVGRTLYALNDFFRWCADNEKAISFIEDKVDLTSWTGRMVASLIAGVAEGELEAIKTRATASQKHIRSVGRWHGGTVPYGYRKVKLDGGGWSLEINPEEAPLVREIVQRARDHESIRSISDDLNARGIPSRRRGNWTPQTLTRMLRSRWIIGQAEHGGRPVMDETGMPVQRADPLIDYSVWKDIQDVLNGRTRPKKRTNETGLLLNVGHCGLCNEPLYHHVMTKPATEKRAAQHYRYWRCSGRTKKRTACDLRNIPAGLLEPYAEEAILAEIGDRPRTVRVFVHATGEADKIAVIQDAIEITREEKNQGLYEGDNVSYLARLKMLTDKKRVLEAVPSSPAHWEQRPTGETFEQAWRRMDTAERRELLLDSGITLRANFNSGAPVVQIHVPKNVLDAAFPVSD
ncbi:MAG: recombinase family protein [Dehalococcoidia bacterium]